MHIKWSFYFLLILLAGCSDQSTILQQIKASGELVVATRWGADTYHSTEYGAAGIEHDLVERFARHLGVKVRYHIADDFMHTIPLTSHNRVDFAAAGLIRSELKGNRVIFSKAYRFDAPKIIGLRGTTRNKDDVFWKNNTVHIVSGSGIHDIFSKLNQDQTFVKTKAHNLGSAEPLVEKLLAKEIDYIAAPGFLVDLMQRYYPQLTVAVPLIEPQPISWAFPKTQDDSLRKEVDWFFTKLQQEGTLASLIDRYQGHINGANYVSNMRFFKHMHKRLPKYKTWFQAASEKVELDWRLLAAMGYQESLWDEKAISPTGVRGIMMLTQITAKEMGVKKRTDPKQSIFGGASYILKLKKRLPADIPEPDRLWFALAAYNVGYGHLQDARRLARRWQLNPNRWTDVKQVLPHLRDKAWHKHTKYGFARGDEAVTYVTNIRHYYDLLSWQEQQNSTSLLSVANLPDVQ